MGEENHSHDGVAQNTPIDFLKRFIPQESEFSELEPLDDDLNLGLSLGGSYTQQIPSETTPVLLIPNESLLIRSSSVNGDSVPLNEGRKSSVSLVRSLSMPADFSEQEQNRKVRHMQAMKRVEVVKRIVGKEKQVEKESQSGGGGSFAEEKPRAEAKLSHFAVKSAAAENNVGSSANLVIQAKVPTISPPVTTSRALENGKSVNPANYSLEPAINFGANGKSAYPVNYCSAPAIKLGKMENGKSAYPASYYPAPVVALEKMDNGKSAYPASYYPAPVIPLEKMENGKSAYPAYYCSAPVIALEKTAIGIPINSVSYSLGPVVKLGGIEKGKLNYPANYCSAPIIALDKAANGKPANLASSHCVGPVEERPSKKVKGNYGSNIDDSTMDVIRQMPSVTTTGDGPNGKKIEGFLYKYMEGQVCIVCVCHGSFLSPAEFVKHAGGGDVENPMKHINVLPASL